MPTPRGPGPPPAGAGIRTALVSNFDTRLRRILRELGADGLFDALAISAEVGAEKPNPVLFGAACAALGLPPEQCVHVGDDRRWAGCQGACTWGGGCAPLRPAHCTPNPTPLPQLPAAATRRNDLYGARDSGCYALLWGCDVHSFADVERRLETGNLVDSLDAPL